MGVETAAADKHITDHRLDTGSFTELIKILLHGILGETVAYGQNAELAVGERVSHFRHCRRCRVGLQALPLPFGNLLYAETDFLEM